jgi:ABC-type branched-subunit amino acid transport system ATPase component
LDNKPAYQRARLGLARTFQALELFEDFSVADNFRVASDPRDTGAYFSNLVHAGKSQWNTAASGAIDEFQLSEFLERSPRDLPHGVRRLVGIARAVATNPAILLLDEPAAGLNDTESAELARLIRKLSHEAGIGILLVEHDMALVTSVCDRVTVLNFGTVIGEGTPAQIQADPAVRDAYLGTAEADDAGSDDRISPRQLADRTAGSNGATSSAP